MLVRDAVDDHGGPTLEVCMLQRNLASEFAAAAFVFPGGKVDEQDRVPASGQVCRGLDDGMASATLGVASGGLAFWVAALRECFEEAGVLVARHRFVDDEGNEQIGELLDTSDPEVARRFAAWRLAVYAGEVTLAEVCERESLVLAVDAVNYVSHWITPELSPKRYDTRFFLTAAPPGQVARHDDGETVDSTWIRPEEALSLCEAGDLELLPPTVANLTAIGQYSDTTALMAWARNVTEVPAILPIVLFDDGQLTVLRPGDEGYEEAMASRADDGEISEEMQQAANRAWGPRTSPGMAAEDATP